MSNNGSLYWITGLSGAGKTTVAKSLHKIFIENGVHPVFLDGDILREVFGVAGAYSIEERLQLALQYSRLCKMLTEQGLPVICATISMFDECRKWNRDNIVQYNEIYLKVPMNILKERDSKEIYSRAGKDEISQVMGVDLEMQEPKNSDLTLVNDGSQEPDEIARQIYEHFS